MSILSSLCLSPLISFDMNSQCAESKWDFPPLLLLFLLLPLERGWSYKIDQKWLVMTPCAFPKDKEGNNKSTHPWLLVLMMHFNEGVNNSASTCGWNGQARLRACWGQRLQRCRLVLSSSAEPAGPTVVIYLAFPAQGTDIPPPHTHPSTSLEKVKAYSPEAVAQRSTSSLGMRDEERMERGFLLIRYRLFA